MVVVFVWVMFVLFKGFNDRVIFSLVDWDWCLGFMEEGLG